MGWRPSTRLTGPAARHDHGLHRHGATVTVTAGRDGRFELSLPPGTYRVTGRSPLIKAWQMICVATAQLHVSRGQPERWPTDARICR